MLPFPGSPVIGAGVGSGLFQDQRGFDRSGTPDIGAVQYQGPSGLTRVFAIDSDGDGNSYGLEQALGTNPFLADSEDPRNLTAPTFNAEGHPVLSFGIADDALSGTLWILERTTDLATFEEIYRFDGIAHFVIEDLPLEVELTDTGVIIIDQAPPGGGVFYRFKARLGDSE